MPLASARVRLLVAVCLVTFAFEAIAVAPAAGYVDTSPERQPQVAAPTEPDDEPSPPADRVEVTEKRTVDSRTFLNPDGTYTSEFFTFPIHYQVDGDDEWLPIELGFRESARAGEVALSDRAPVAIGLGESTAADGFLVVESGPHRITFSVPASIATGLTPVRPVINGIAADYADFLPGVDLRVLAGAKGPKSFLILDEPPAVPSWTFAVDAPGLELVPQEDGSVQFVTRAGEAVAYMPHPYAVDSSVDEGRGDGEYTDKVELSVSSLGGVNLVTISADPVWLASATYPVYVDPTVTLYTTSQSFDAHVSQAWPNSNYANYQRPTSPYYYEMWLGMDPTNSVNVNDDYIKFDVSSIAGTTVDLGQLRFHPYHQYYAAPTQVTTWVRRVTTDWNETTITWNNRPAANSNGTINTVKGQTAYYTATSLIQQWVSGITPNYGFRLDQNGNNGTYWKRLVASEQTGSLVPALVVNYHVPTATPSSPTGSAWTNSRSLTWSYSDPAGHAQSHYEVQVSTVSDFGSILVSSGQVASSSTSWSIPTGTTLTNGTTYYWRVRAKDGTSWSPWSAGAAFRWDGSAPSFTSAAVGGAITADDPNYYDLGNGTFTVAIRGSDPHSGIKLSYLRLYNGSDEMRVYHDWSVGGAHCDEFDASTLVDATACAETYNSGGTREVTFTVAGLNQSTSFDAHYYFTDYSGNTVGYDDTGKNVIFDATAPTGSITSPAASATVSGTVPITGTASDANFTQYELHYGEGASPSSWSSIGTNPRTSPVTDGTLGTWNVTGLTSGTYTTRLRVYDKARVSSGFTEVLRTVSVDNNAPTAIISSPTGDRLVDGTFDITGTASATFAFSDYTLRYGVGCAPSDWLDIGTNPRTSQVTNGTLGTWNSDGLSGKHAIRLTVNRTDGQTSTATVCVTLGSSLGRQSQHSFETWDLGGGDELAVNVATGNAVISHPLVSLPYRGGTLALSLVHNSFSANDRGLGPGWQLSEQRRLGLWLGNGTVTFVDGDGSRHHFTSPVTNGSVTTYTRPASLYATLVRDTANPDEFTLTYRDGSVDTFYLAGTAGRLTRSADRHGNALTYAYDGAGNLDTITDPAGRTVNFTWDTIPDPHRLTAISDWAWIDGSGVVQTTSTGSRRTYRFFYDGASQLAGWSDPLNASGSCPTGGSHLACLAYTSGRLTGVTKTQTVTTFNAGTLGTATRAITTAISYGADGRVTSVTDAEQVAQSGPATSFTWETASRVRVNRPTTTTSYGLVEDDDPYGRVDSIWRHFDAETLIERRTVWESAFPIEPASITDNYGALLSTPARTVSYTYVAGSLGLLSRIVEPLDGSTNRWTDYTYNANNDVTQLIVSKDGSASERTIARYCYSDPCSTSGVGPNLIKQIENYVDGGPYDDDTNVTTEFVYDAYAQRTRTIRHNCMAANPCLVGGGTWTGGRDHRIDGFAYDNQGNLTAEIINYSDGEVTNPGDDITPNETTLARTDVTTAHAYDTAGNRVSTADPRRPIEAAKGTSLGADDFVTRWTYDALNQPLTEKTPTTPGLASTQRTGASAYDELGLVRSATDFGGLATANELDRSGRMLRTFEDPDPGSATATSQMTYNADGRLLTAKDRRQVADASLGLTTYGHDSIGRQTSVIGAAGTAGEAETATGYDALDRRTSYEVGVGAAASLLSTYVFDLGGRIVQTDDGSACTQETFDYRDLAFATTSGLVGGLCSNGAEQRIVAHIHDGLGRRTRSEVTGGAGTGDRTVDDAFDAAGNRRSAAVRTGGATSTTSFTVNLLDQVVGEARADGSTAKTTYDPAANAADRCFWAPGVTVGVCHPVGTSPWPEPPTQVTTTGYDARNQRISLADAAAGSVTTYDPEHNYEIKALYRSTGSGREHQSLYAYDVRHRLTGITFQTCAANASHACTDTPVNSGSDSYAYDDADNRTQVVESNSATITDFRYCYDARHEVIYRNTAAACSASTNDEAWTYDDAGNRLTATAGGSTTNFAYQADGRLCDIEVAPNVAVCLDGNVSHDSAGRIKGWTSWSFSYDAEGRLTSACKSATCASGFDKVEFIYDGQGHRTKLVATSAGGAVTTTEFRYQGDALVEEKVNGTVARQFVTDGSGAITKLIVPAGQPEAGTYLVNWSGHGDALNLVRVNGDGSTTLANSFTYDTWGRPTTSTHNGIVDLGFRYLYVGQFDVQWDDQFGLGLLYMQTRHYAPALGRFLQPDPARIEANAYAYAQNTPVTRVDPCGTEGVCPQEITFCSNPRNAWTCTVAFSASRAAIRESVAHFGYGPTDGTRQNAVQHCIWNAAMTARLGIDVAKGFADRHESCQSWFGWRGMLKLMDLQNNYIGRQLGLKIGWWNTFGASKTACLKAPLRWLVSR